MAEQPRLFGLLVGVDHYQSPSITNLKGCVADALAMHTFLTAWLGVAEQNLRLLTATGNEPPQRVASRANILAAWEELMAQLEPGDQFFFHFSGHGAQAPSIDPHEPDGFDETLIPCDSRTNGPDGQPIYDILDKEMAALIGQAEAKEALVTIFLDCCHSGSGTRAAAQPDASTPLVRRSVQDRRIRPPHTLVPGTLEGMEARANRPRSASGWEVGGGHVLLAGCRDEELSHEYASPETGQWHGATTYFLLSALQNYHPYLTWREVHGVVQSRVNAIYSRQMPQLEGPGNRAVFGGLRPPQRPHLLATEKEQAPEGIVVRINAGAPLGLTQGSQVALYPPLGEMDQPLAQGEVLLTRADHCWARLTTAMDFDAIEIPSRVTITGQNYESQVYPVAVDDPLLLAELAPDEAGDSALSPFLRVVPAQDPTAFFRVQARDGQMGIFDGSGAQIVTQLQPQTPEGAAALAKNLIHLAVYHNVRRLRNPEATPQMEQALAVSAVSYTRLGFSGPTDPLPIDSVHNALPPGRNVWLSVRNEGSEPLYVALFNLTGNYGIYQEYPPRGPYQRLDPGKDFSQRFAAPVLNSFAERGLEIFKVFATKDPQPLDALTLPDLNQPLPTTRTRSQGPLAALLDGVGPRGTRRMQRLEEEMHERWITKQVEITILNQHHSAALADGAQAVEIGSPLDLVVEKPADFSGELVISSLERMTRGADQPAIWLPPGLSGPEAQPFFQPVSLERGTRSVDAPPAVFTLSGEPDQLAQISPQQPLRLELTVDDEPDLAGVIPIAFDGEDFVLVGEMVPARTRSLPPAGSRRFAFAITHLPDPVDPPAGPGETRELRRTARLFFYKLYRGQLPQDAGLRRIVYTPGETSGYLDAKPGDLAGVKRVALMVHGFNSDTRWYADRAIPRIHPHGKYDLYLSYDYESFGTPIEESGAVLAQKLALLGFGPEDGLHLDIYCHSMGSQVVRALVEMKGGDAYVDRVIMAGPPNAGTRLADGKLLVRWLAMAGVNTVGTVVPGRLAEMLVEGIVESAKGIEDLRPGSDLFQSLNNSVTPIDVAYYVQIGTNAVVDEAFRWSRLFSKSGFAKLKDTTLDLIFGGPHDIAVPVSSARSVRHGNWPRLTVTELKGDHFRYFQSDESEKALAEWLENEE